MSGNCDETETRALARQRNDNVIANTRQLGFHECPMSREIISHGINRLYFSFHLNVIQFMYIFILMCLDRPVK